MSAGERAAGKEAEHIIARVVEQSGVHDAETLVQKVEAAGARQARGAEELAARVGPAELEVPAVRNGQLAGDVHPNTGVPFDAQGYPDFSQWRHPDVPDVVIEPSGTRGGDFARANEAAGLPRTPEGYTWHHHEDVGRMQLIERRIHAATGHTGGFSIWGRLP